MRTRPTRPRCRRSLWCGRRPSAAAAASPPRAQSRRPRHRATSRARPPRHTRGPRPPPSKKSSAKKIEPGVDRARARVERPFGRGCKPAVCHRGPPFRRDGFRERACTKQAAVVPSLKSSRNVPSSVAQCVSTTLLCTPRSCDPRSHPHLARAPLNRRQHAAVAVPPPDDSGGRHLPSGRDEPPPGGRRQKPEKTNDR